MQLDFVKIFMSKAAFFLTSLLLLSSSFLKSQIRYGNNPAAGGYVKQDGAKIYYEVYGKGDPVVMLHGGVYGYIDEFAPLIDSLSLHYKVICIATRGHGKSEIGNQNFSWQQRANDAFKVVQHVTNKSVVVIGFSDGAYTGYKLAAMYPGLVKKLIAMGAGDRPETENREQVNYTTEMLMKQAGSLFEKRLKLMPEPARWAECLAKLNDLYNKESLSKETFSKINCPVLLISGEKDQRHSPVSMAKVANYIRNSSLHIINNCPHVLLTCNFKKVWQQISEFMDNTNSFGSDIEKYSQLLQLPGLAVGVAYGDSLIFFRGIDIGDSLSKQPLTADHVFPIASITKSFTAIALKQMEAEGKISLNDTLSKYGNQFFNKNRWDSKTTLAHIISHTSESNPLGTNFVYNGSKFNLVFNVFLDINKTRVQNDVTRPFTDEIQTRIVKPLKMNHTLLRFSENEYGHLRKWMVTTYRLIDSSGKFIPVDFDPVNMQSGPAYGMMSSVNDLAKYSSALLDNKLLTGLQHRQLTKPFYSNSPHGMGWFTTFFEGIEINWTYGYGDNDASLLLQVPSKKLTLIVLSPVALPSFVAKLGYGNPFNSMLVCSFFKNYLQEKSINSRFAIEEKFAEAITLSFLPATFQADTVRANVIIQKLMKDYPSDKIWQTSTAFELVGESKNRDMLQFGLKMANEYIRLKKIHPVKAWYAGLIYEKNGMEAKAIDCFKSIADGDEYREQPYKFNAMMALARRYKISKPDLSWQYLQNLIKFKEYISVNDQQTKEANQMLEELSKD